MRLTPAANPFLAPKPMKFIDLFAGLGGFHTGLANLGHKCVFACELNADLREIYKKNHGIMPHDDIRTAVVEKISGHDIPVLLVTAASKSIIPYQFHRCPRARYLQKPVLPPDILKNATELLAKTPSGT